MTRDDSEETTEKERGLREEESDESVRVVRVEREREVVSMSNSARVLYYYYTS